MPSSPSDPFAPANLQGATAQLGEEEGLQTITLADGEPDQAQVDAADVPAQIDRYLVLDTLGEGGMGVVYAAFDPKLDRKVAIKVLRAGRQTINARPRLLREAKALAKLSHPNVVAVFDVGTVGTRVFLAMEHVEGRTLTQWQREQGQTWETLLAAYTQAGVGLAAAHRSKLVHRDFKPDNVLVDLNGRVRVLDFGLAVGEQDEAPTQSEDGLSASSRLTLTGHVMGTPAYMSPEQLRGEAPDGGSDQFSFCVALFEALYGWRPFGGKTVTELRAAALGGVIREPEDRGHVPSWVHSAIVRGLSRKPAQRWPSMDALLVALDPERRLRRRRAGIVGSAVLACASLAAIALQASAAPSQPSCTAVGDKVHAAWNEDVRLRVQASLMASGLPYAAETWTRVEPGLDHYAAGWAESRQEACVAAPASQAGSDLRVLCLDDRLETFSALTELLQDADEGVVRNAARAVSTLPNLSRCNDVDALRSAVADPPSAGVAEAVADVRRTVAAARAMLLAGRTAAAADVTDEAVALARVTEYAPVIAEALVLKGIVGERLGDYAGAEAAQTEAAMLASESEHMAVAAHAMSQLTGTTGYHLARPQDGLSWGRHAQALVERGDVGRQTRVQLANNIGAVHFRAGDLTAALAQYEEAATLLTEPLEPSELHELAATRNNLGNTLAMLHRTAESQVQLEAALELTTQLRGAHHPEISVIVGNLANVYLDQGKFDAAVEHNRRALELRVSTLPASHPHIASSHINLGLSYLARGERGAAKRHLLTAVELRDVPGQDPPGLALALSNLGETQRALGEYEAAVVSHTRAMDIWIETLGPDHAFVGYPSTNLGLDHLALGNLDKARSFLERSLEICATASDPTLLALTELGLAELFVASDEQPQRALALASRAADALVGSRYPSDAARAASLAASLGR